MFNDRTIDEHFRVERMFLGTTFDDFTDNPQCGIAEHRDSIPLKTKFSRNITLNLPVVSANMRTVTGSVMAIAMAQEGGIGILPRGGASIDLEASWVKEVKRVENLIIANPYTIRHDQTVAEARALMEKHKIGTLLVTKDDQFIGLLYAKRKMMLYGTEKSSQLVHEIMTPVDGCNIVRKLTIDSVEKAAGLLEHYDSEKIVLLDETNHVKGLITMKDIANLLHHKWANKDINGRLIVGAAVGVTGDCLERASELIRAGVDVVVMDTAYAHNTKTVLPAIEEFRKKFGSFELVCGNVATYEGAAFLRNLGVDGIKVGVGPGAGCQTRNATGVGVGQLDAIRTAFLASREIPIIADGGVRKTGDISKGLCAGASCAMLGEFLAGTDEAPGNVINHPMKGRIKIYMGETSPQAKLSDIGSSGDIRNVEGQEKEIKHQGSVKEILRKIRENLQSMVSYMGGEDLASVRAKVGAEPWRYFRPASPATQRESVEK